jgi:hypothetical protein
MAESGTGEETQTGELTRGNALERPGMKSESKRIFAFDP